MTIRGLAHVVFACLVTSFADGCGASINTLKVDFILFDGTAESWMSGANTCDWSWGIFQIRNQLNATGCKAKKAFKFFKWPVAHVRNTWNISGLVCRYRSLSSPKNCFSKVCSFTTEIDANLLLHSELNQDNVMRGICVGWNRWNYPYFYALADSEIIGWRDK